MPFSSTSYDPETLALLERAFDEAWQQVKVASPLATQNGSMQMTREKMAIRIMGAANDGERDPDRLKLLAIESVSAVSVT